MKFIEFPKTQDRKRNQLDNFVFTTRVRIARNIEGLNFPLTLSSKEKSIIDEKVFERIKELPCDIEKETIDEMGRDNTLIYLSNHVITNEFLKFGRTFVYEINGGWVILLNEDDHIRILSIENGFNPRQIYRRISDVMDKIEEKIDFSYDEHYGYLTASILNVGTGLRISSIVNLYGLVAMKKIEKFIETANKMGYSAVNLLENGDSGLFMIYNIYSLGVSEEELLMEYEQFLIKVFQLETKSRMEYFNNKDEMELSFEEIHEISVKESLDYSALVYYISLIDALNKKFISVNNIQEIRNLIFHASDDYLIYKYSVEPDSTGKVRLNMLRNLILQIKYRMVKI